MEIINKYFNPARLAGNIYNYSEKSAVVLEIFNFSDISNTIIPFFGKYPIIGVKRLDYLDWCKVAKLIAREAGRHLTEEGLSSIKSIKENMNRGRKAGS